MSSDSIFSENSDESAEPGITVDNQPKTSSLARLVKINLAITLVLVLSLGIGAYFSLGPIGQFRNTDPEIDGYVQPRSIASLVDLVQESTVSIYCDYGPGELDYITGSGWSFEIETDRQDEYPTALVTNHHVIEECLNGKGKLFVAALGGEEYPAVIDNWDIENDLAVIATKLVVPPLYLSENKPYPGYWVMAVGTADGYEGSVAFGNVLNVTDTVVLITAAISSGNSGGPLIDNEGYVVGTNTWSKIGEQYNGAMSLDAMCGGIMECDGGKHWKNN
jgi:S1-C subfamily serine protease